MDKLVLWHVSTDRDNRAQSASGSVSKTMGERRRHGEDAFLLRSITRMQHLQDHLMHQNICRGSTRSSCLTPTKEMIVKPLGLSYRNLRICQWSTIAVVCRVSIAILSSDVCRCHRKRYDS